MNNKKEEYNERLNKVHSNLKRNNFLLEDSIIEHQLGNEIKYR